jgi:hypothetical protein
MEFSRAINRVDTDDVIETSEFYSELTQLMALDFVKIRLSLLYYLSYQVFTNQRSNVNRITF